MVLRHVDLPCTLFQNTVSRFKKNKKKTLVRLCFSRRWVCGRCSWAVTVVYMRAVCPRSLCVRLQCAYVALESRNGLRWVFVCLLSFLLHSCVETGCKTLNRRIRIYCVHGFSQYIIYVVKHLWDFCVQFIFCVVPGCSAVFLLLLLLLTDVLKVEQLSPPWSWESLTVLNHSDVSKWLSCVKFPAPQSVDRISCP